MVEPAGCSNSNISAVLRTRPNAMLKHSTAERCIASLSVVIGIPRARKPSWSRRMFGNTMSRTRSK